MGVSGSRRGSRYFWLGELIGVDVEDVGVVEVGVPLRFAGVVVSAKDDDGCSGESGGVPPSWTGTYSLDDRIGPLPSPNL